MYIEPRGKSLIIRWNVDGKAYHISLPKHNNPVGKAAAQMKLAAIKKDILSGHFDSTLLKYKPRKVGKNPTVITAAQLFDKYAAHRLEHWELSDSSKVRFKGISSKLTQFLGDKPAEKVTADIAANVIAVWSEQVATRTIRAYLFDLAAAWDWAKKNSQYILGDVNPWHKSLDRLKRSKLPLAKSPTPFTITELQAIIAAFRSHPHYCHYTEFVVFLASTACRPGEAVGLRWKHLGEDFTTVWIGESISRGRQNKKGTKTGKSRDVQLSPSVRSMLVERFDRLKPQPEDLVFPSPKGLSIDDHRFRARAWKTILESCRIEYRSPYKIRHSAISHALQNGANFIALAEQTGHDKRVLLSTYAHVIDPKCLFVDVGQSQNI